VAMRKNSLQCAPATTEENNPVGCTACSIPHFTVNRKYELLDMNFSYSSFNRLAVC